MIAMHVRHARSGMLAALLSAALLPACVPQRTADDWRYQAQRLEETLAQRDRELAAARAANAELNERIAAAQGFDPSQLKVLIYPESISIESLSGGYDDDGLPGDDGVVVYVKPLDREGDALKAAGDIRVQVFDLGAVGDERDLGEWTFTAEQARELWYGSWMTYHYALKCPWKDGRPYNTELTVRVTFTNRVPVRVMTAQQVVRVQPPPAVGT
ncbi:MAG: hypothetical protein AB7Q17_05470 [Phycisphaerae bacterium]